MHLKEQILNVQIFDAKGSKKIQGRGDEGILQMEVNSRVASQ